jgi:hypothetical protein
MTRLEIVNRKKRDVTVGIHFKLFFCNVHGATSGIHITSMEHSPWKADNLKVFDDGVLLK